MSLRRMELIVSRMLNLGVIICGVTMVSGLTLIWFSGDASNPSGVLSIDWMLWGDPFLQPSHLIFMGFLILVAMPVMRVGTSVIIYVYERDWVYVTIAGIVLTILLAGMFLGIK